MTGNTVRQVPNQCPVHCGPTLNPISRESNDTQFFFCVFWNSDQCCTGKTTERAEFERTAAVIPNECPFGPLKPRHRTVFWYLKVLLEFVAEGLAPQRQSFPELKIPKKLFEKRSLGRQFAKERPLSLS